MKRYFLYCVLAGVIVLAAVNSSSLSSGTKVVPSAHVAVTIQAGLTLNDPHVNSSPNTLPVARKISREDQLLTDWNGAEPGSEDRASIMQRYVSLGGDVVARFTELLNRLPEEEREDFLSVALEVVVSESPAEAARLAEAMGTPEALAAVASLWAAKDPASAAAWVLTQADKVPDIVAPLISTWAETDPMAASQWLVTLPSGAARDSGVVLLLPQLLETDAEAAEAWINNISDPIARAGMAAQLANVQGVPVADF